MTSYRVEQAPAVSESREGYERIVSITSAQLGTYIVIADPDGSVSKTNVIAWGVCEDSSAVPISLMGAWGGVTNRNMFVQHPDGRCEAFEEEWENATLAAMAVKDRSP